MPAQPSHEPPRAPAETDVAVRSERQRLAAELMELTRGPLNALAVVWLVLVMLELAGLLPPGLMVVDRIIWGVFAVAFLMDLWIAPDRRAFLRDNWFSGLSLMVPALRIARVLRGARLFAGVQALRALTISRVVASLNKSLFALNRVLRRHQLGYVIAITFVVVLVAASLIFRYERTAVLGRPPTGGAIDTFADAVWWAAGAASFAGSDYDVRTNIGRALRLFMSFYSWSGFGYLTATVASHFVAPAGEEDAPDPVAALTEEVRALRREVERLTQHLGAPGPADATAAEVVDARDAGPEGG